MIKVIAKVHSRTELESNPGEKLVYFQVAPDNTFGVRLPDALADELRAGDRVTISVEKVPA